MARAKKKEQHSLSVNINSYEIEEVVREFIMRKLGINETLYDELLVKIDEDDYKFLRELELSYFIEFER